MKKLISLFILLTSVAYSADYVPLVREATSQLAKKLKKEQNIRMCGYGGAMMNDVKEVSLYFVGNQRKTIDEVRRLYVEGVEVYLKRINDDILLRPHLRNYPFELRNLEFSISFEDKPGARVPDGYVALVFNSHRRNSIVYCGYDNSVDDFTDLYEEPYEEALRIVQEEGYLDQIHYIEPKKKKSRRRSSKRNPKSL